VKCLSPFSGFSCWVSGHELGVLSFHFILFLGRSILGRRLSRHFAVRPTGSVPFNFPPTTSVFWSIACEVFAHVHSPPWGHPSPAPICKSSLDFTTPHVFFLHNSPFFLAFPAFSPSACFLLFFAREGIFALIASSDRFGKPNSGPCSSFAEHFGVVIAFLSGHFYLQSRVFSPPPWLFFPPKPTLSKVSTLSFVSSC